MLLGRAVLACALTGFEWTVGSTQQAARQNPCSKPKVYVKVAFVEGVEEYLNHDRGSRTNQEWLDYISQTAVEWLRASGGEGVDVIPHEGKVFVDDMPETPEPENSFSDPVPGEYVFRLYLGLADRRDPMTGVRDQAKNDYLAQASPQGGTSASSRGHCAWKALGSARAVGRTLTPSGETFSGGPSG